MPKIELGSVGVALDPGPSAADAAATLERLGYPTIWVTGGPLANLGQVAEVVRATQNLRVASAILSVDRFPAEDVAALYADLEATHPGRFVVGLGGAHGPKPIETLNAYLDRLESVPVSARVMAALGPRMLELARRRASGAFPVLITPDYTAQVRSQLGDDTTLAVEQLVVFEADPARARELARVPLGFLGSLPAYQASFRRMGFSDDEIAQLADRLVDALVAWGDVDVIAARLAEHRQAGADHVAAGVGRSDALPVDQLAQLAATLIPD